MALRGGIDLLDHAAIGILDIHSDMRPNDIAAIADCGVGDRHLERIGLQITLPDREVDVVADRPRARGLTLFEQLVTPLWRRQEPRNLPWEVDSGRLSDPELRGPLLLGVTLSLVEHRADVVEPNIGRDLERLGQLQCPVGAAAGVVLCRSAGAGQYRAIVDNRRGRSQYAALERGDRGDRLERPARRIETLDGAIRQGGPGARAGQRLIG